MSTISLFAGPGGVDVGAGLLGLDLHGWDLDVDACATATAAGYARTRGSVTDLDPEEMRGITGAVITPPCPTFSTAGRRTGQGDMPRLLDALTLLGDNRTESDTRWREAAVSVQDPRSALVCEVLRFALHLPHLQWLVCEQVPAAGRIWQEISAEMAAVGDFDYAVVVTVAAEDLGVASRRTRTFLLATRHWPPVLDGLPIRSGWQAGRWIPPEELVPQAGAAFGAPSMADVLGWPAGERVNTRGNRRTSGGNEFSADGPSWCLTEKARTWRRVSDGARLTPADAGLLVGFPRDYPWQGSRSKQFLQAADVVPPPVAAAVIGACLGLDWQSAVREYLAGIYPAGTLAPVARQQTLWEASRGLRHRILRLRPSGAAGQQAGVPDLRREEGRQAVHREGLAGRDVPALEGVARRRREGRPRGAAGAAVGRVSGGVGGVLHRPPEEALPDRPVRARLA